VVNRDSTKLQVAEGLKQAIEERIDQKINLTELQRMSKTALCKILQAVTVINKPAAYVERRIK
jgi:hypothetical protein